MSEAHLQAHKPPAGKPGHPGAGRDLVATWSSGDGVVTAYDEHWYQGRPQRP